MNNRKIDNAKDLDIAMAKIQNIYDESIMIYVSQISFRFN